MLQFFWILRWFENAKGEFIIFIAAYDKIHFRLKINN